MLQTQLDQVIEEESKNRQEVRVRLIMISLSVYHFVDCIVERTLYAFLYSHTMCNHARRLSAVYL